MNHELQEQNREMVAIDINKKIEILIKVLMINPQNCLYQQMPDAHRSYSHYQLHNGQTSQPQINNHSSQCNNNNDMSAPISRTRIHSFQQHPHQNIDPRQHTQSIIKKRQQKLLKYRQINHLSKHQPSLSISSSNHYHNSNHNRNSIFKESNGIMNQPPDYILNKYTFKNQEEQLVKKDGGIKDCAVFGSCCAIIKQTQKEVFLSPTQLITMKYFVPMYKQQPKSLKINNYNHIHNKSYAGLNKSQHQNKSFFKDNNY